MYKFWYTDLCNLAFTVLYYCRKMEPVMVTGRRLALKSALTWGLCAHRAHLRYGTNSTYFLLLH